MSNAMMKDNSIKLSTLHSAKGLEFDYVFILDISQSSLNFIINKNQGFDSEEIIAREKRLLYTGMTRAKEQLTMIYKNELCSLFEDIDHNLLDHININCENDVNIIHKLTA